ncbi:NAD(P)/FAD-dependent oxidoreductase [Advenella mimigardefordensis]|uniref:Putative FAD-dependent pyridine nucleotide-disulfide oxidoreductase n=1 Tax=Advenella mimigardefordensis (strain DSM 17166 / LMG 22922 / DPN7) TaxID=1247726 RepID=W0PJR9_ADVMD|nr:FAD-dependent oxidoreductase [Advenella mimigardefordensis]AHG65223.1 putative FAD-dependent pyridine nucleotide-disulfide oxidoreductase [Advenella mimigardefordensis DPN7]
MSTREHVVVVGAGHAGGRVVQHLRSLGFAGQLTLIGDEPHLPYERPALSKEVLKGQRQIDELALAPAAFWSDESQVQYVSGKASSLDSEKKRLVLEGGRELEFDKLVVATGGRARLPRIPGATLPNVFTLRTIEDSLALRSAIESASNVVVVGAGVIGMEVAASARQMGANVTVLEAGEHVLARCLPRSVSQWLRSVHEDKGCVIRTGVQVNAIVPTSDALSVEIAQGDDHASIAADLVLIAVGIDCAVDFLEGSGIANADGIPIGVDCTSPVAPWCYAAGDVALTYHPMYQRHVRQETWRNAENQSLAVAQFIMGRSEPYQETPWMWTDQFDANIQVLGFPLAGAQDIVRRDADANPSAVLMMREERLIGAVLINRARDRKHLEPLVRESATISAERAADSSIPFKALQS